MKNEELEIYNLVDQKETAKVIITYHTEPEQFLVQVMRIMDRSVLEEWVDAEYPATEGIDVIDDKKVFEVAEKLAVELEVYP